jgi:hypothetical protein
VGTGVSGAKSDRSARNQPMEAARRRQFELVLLLRLDRSGRSAADCVRPQGGGKLTCGPVPSGGGGWEEGAGGRQALRLLESKAAGKSWEGISRQLGVPVDTYIAPSTTVLATARR